jgi:hypothetical protein
MNDLIECPHCHKTFPATEAFKHQVREDFEREQKPIMWKKALAAAEERTKGKNDQELKLMKEQLEEEKKKREESEKNELQLRKERIKFEEEKRDFELTSQRKLDEERKKIADESYKKAIEENHFKNLEHEKKESSYLKQIEELKQKMEQGSQQTQGEVVEEELKKILATEFPYDEISDVPKGIRGADLIQVVKNNLGKECGKILWESKRTKAWTEGWITKLKQDQREIKAELAIIVTQVMPQGTKNFGVKEGIWVVDYQTVIGAAVSLRNNLIDLFGLRSANKGKEEKKEILWNYLTSVEFKQRVEAIYESYNDLLEELKKEKDWFTKKWAREEKSIGRVSDNLLGMHGDLEGIVGKTLPELEELKKIESGD